MNRLFPLSIFIALILVGCSEQQLHTYNPSKIKDSIRELEYKPEIPMYLPFEAKDIKIESTQVGGGKTLSVKFYDQNNDSLSLHILNGTGNVIDFTDEKVRISDSLFGKYGEGPEGSQILRWNKDRIFYELFLPEDYSKAQLIKVAKNFKVVE